MEPGRDGFSSGAVVTGQHNDPNAFGMKGADCVRRACLDWIGDGDQAGWRVVYSEENHCGSVFAERIGIGRQRPRIDVSVLKQCRIAQDYVASTCDPDDTFARDRSELFCGFESQTAFTCLRIRWRQPGDAR